MGVFFSGQPVEDPSGRIRTFDKPNQFQVTMLEAPCASFNACCWCMGQAFWPTAGCAQYLLRRKVLEGDMSRYACCQGQLNFCGIGAGSFGETNCPDFCACLEGWLCNCCAVSASRIYVMERYDLRSDPCDYRLIQVNNCLQITALCCFLLTLISNAFQECYRIISCLADLIYYAVSGCMTAQTAHEMDYRTSIGVGSTPPAATTVITQPTAPLEDKV